MIPGQKENHPSFKKSFGFALQGFRFALRTERNIKVMLGAGVVAILFGFLFRLNELEWGLVILSCGAVLFAELINTAIETIVDLVSPEYHDLAGKAKDISAAAVYVLSIAVGILGVVIYLSAGLRLFS